MDPETKAIKDWLKKHRISEVEVLVPDMTGSARGKFIPAHQFLGRGNPRLPESIMIQSVTGEYSDSHWDFVEPTDADMILRPDASTMRVVPWAREPTAQIIHDCFTMDGEPHPLATRNILRKVLNLYEAEGLRPVVAPEVEFYLVSKNLDPDYVLTPPPGIGRNLDDVEARTAVVATAHAALADRQQHAVPSFGIQITLQESDTEIERLSVLARRVIASHQIVLGLTAPGGVGSGEYQPLILRNGAIVIPSFLQPVREAKLKTVAGHLRHPMGRIGVRFGTCLCECWLNRRIPPGFIASEGAARSGQRIGVS